MDKALKLVTDMKKITLLLVLLLSGCVSIQESYKRYQADTAKSDAERLGNSGPLYNHYESCLNLHWEDALDSGEDAFNAYETGKEHCEYELSLLCDFYGVSSCPLDAEAANRVLFRLMRENYAAELAP